MIFVLSMDSLFPLQTSGEKMSLEKMTVHNVKLKNGSFSMGEQPSLQPPQPNTPTASASKQN